MKKVVDRFLNYVAIDTKSEYDSQDFPSSKKQFELANLLVKELNELGLKDVSVDENCYVMATLPSNTDKKVPTIGFIAHMDTSPDMSGENVKPKIVENYDGGDIILNKENNIVLSPKDFPELKEYIGKTLITTDGTTLLGADDKAGIAEIMTAIEYLVNNPQIEHGDIKVAFTPDEEVGRGADYFDVKKFNADFAYTVDGGRLGELEYENFNAAGVKLTIKGRNVHPGSAKNKMINSMEIAMELNSMLPENQKPKYTEGYEGFFLLSSLNGDVEETKASYIIRDHFRDKFEEKKGLMQKVVDFLNAKYGEGTVHLEIKDQYYNMKEKIEPVMHIVDTAKRAMEELGITPLITPVRGGTDGARLSYMGLPCPNLFTGGHNYHGKYEFIPVESMEKAVEVILKIIELYSKGSK
ncbi:tripeptide aminopeptidase [Proteiniborus sp. DW1]|uniref:peptidase T n=1 Tax=Proteiniborus sp. DW1 TaxID=1889883 RepID=UPI00092E1604|nr:peptidase T [Proteiniborus sp. DW1]SCG82301.1 tripeptide aminopeptidase [Proteiniborus sp. DW1]